MKKLILLAALSAIMFSAQAEDKPLVSVNVQEIKETFDKYVKIERDKDGNIIRVSIK